LKNDFGFSKRKDLYNMPRPNNNIRSFCYKKGVDSGFPMESKENLEFWKSKSNLIDGTILTAGNQTN
jgi:hypothetical protein